MSNLIARREKYTGGRARRYEATRQGEFWDLEQATMAKAVDAIEPGTTVLDCPVGTGRFLPLYAARGLDVTGVDLSTDMLAQAKAKGTGATLRTGSIFALDFPVGAFDVAVCVRLLNWLETPELPGALSELARVIRPDGYVIAGAGTRTGPVPRRSVQCIHVENEFLEQVEHAGLQVEERHLVQHNDRGLFEFWQLAATP